ncbi:unnamed protein product, partial [Prorocentrum cordatum]
HETERSGGGGGTSLRPAAALGRRGHLQVPAGDRGGPSRSDGLGSGGDSAARRGGCGFGFVGQHQAPRARAHPVSAEEDRARSELGGGLARRLPHEAHGRLVHGQLRGPHVPRDGRSAHQVEAVEDLRVPPRQRLTPRFVPQARPLGPRALRSPNAAEGSPLPPAPRAACLLGWPACPASWAHDWRDVSSGPCAALPRQAGSASCAYPAAFGPSPAAGRCPFSPGRSCQAARRGVWNSSPRLRTAAAARCLSATVSSCAGPGSVALMG